MRELAIVSTLLGAIVGLSFLGTLPWEDVMRWGWWMVGAGMALGVPMGFLYHVALRRALKARDVLPARWWWSPIRLNASLTEDERRWVLPWMWAGGVGFVFVTLGLAVVVLGILSAWSSLAEG